MLGEASTDYQGVMMERGGFLFDLYLGFGWVWVFIFWFLYFVGEITIPPLYRVTDGGRPLDRLSPTPTPLYHNRSIVYNPINHPSTPTHYYTV